MVELSLFLDLNFDFFGGGIDQDQQVQFSLLISMFQLLILLGLKWNVGEAVDCGIGYSLIQKKVFIFR